MGRLFDYPFDPTVWGTVGQWAAAVFSGASLLIALSILRNDRRKDQWIEARLVRLNFAGGSGESPVKGKPLRMHQHFTLTNQSHFSVWVLRTDARVRKQADGRKVWETMNSNPESGDPLQPATKMGWDVVTSFESQDDSNFYVYFRDYKGTKWRRHSRSDDLIEVTRLQEVRNFFVSKYKRTLRRK